MMVSGEGGGGWAWEQENMSMKVIQENLNNVSDTAIHSNLISSLFTCLYSYRYRDNSMTNSTRNEEEMRFGRIAVQKKLFKFCRV